MRLASILLVLFLSVLLLSAATFAETMVITVAASTAPAGSAEWSIEHAADPSAATDDYVKGISSGGDIAALEAAYVKRMVDFGVPDMATTQAADLAQRKPDNGVAHAVVAYGNAKRGEMNAALADIAKAVERAPDDPFVQRTAGQLIAWYDARADRSKVPDDLQQSIDAMRRRIGQSPTFVYAYEKSREGMRAGTDVTPYAQSQPASTPVAAAPPTLYDQPNVYVAPNATPAGAPDNYIPYNAYGYTYNDYAIGGWPYYYGYYGPVWYGPAVIVRGGFHSRGFEGRGFEGRGFDGHGFHGGFRGDDRFGNSPRVGFRGQAGHPIFTPRAGTGFGGGSRGSGMRSR